MGARVAVWCWVMLAACSSESRIASVEDLARGDAEISARLTRKSLPWVQEGSLRLPPGFGGFAVTLPHTGSDALVVGTSGTPLLTLTARNAKASALEFEGHRAVYREVFPATDSVLVNGTDFVEQLWLLKNESSPRRFEFDVGLPGLVKHVREANGGLEFTDERGEVVLRMPRPWGVDALGVRVPARVRWSGHSLTVELTSDALHFPVLLDPVIERLGWTVMTSIPTRSGHSMVSYHGKVLLFGGSVFGMRLNDFWEWDGSTWTELQPATRPSARTRHAMAVVGDKVVLFGGSEKVPGMVGSVGLADTWEWDGTTWTEKTPAVSPPPANTWWLMAGGASKGVLLGRTIWEWDGTTWTQKSASPPSGALLAIATVGNRVLLLTRDAFTGDSLMEWTGTAWVAAEPLPAGLVRAVSIASIGSTLVLLGSSGADRFDSMWALNGTAWSPLSSATAPNLRWEYSYPDLSVAVAARGDKLVLFGGAPTMASNFLTLNDTWEWDATSGWVDRTPVTVPSPRARHSLATLGSKVVLFGGEAWTFQGTRTLLDDTWEWDGTSWTLRHPATSPPARSSAGMATLAGKVVLFGGRGPSSALDDTWEWDGTTWTEKQPASSPGPRADFGMATLAQKVVLFGGANSGELAETWEWDGTTWLQRTPATSPPARVLASFAAFGDRLVLFGGLPEKNDTWEWDGVNWMRRTPLISPSARSGSGMTAIGDRLVLFGSDERGAQGAEYLPLNDTWEWDGTTWTERRLLVSPSGRGSPMATLDGRAVIFGGSFGIGRGKQGNDTWQYRLVAGLGATCTASAECESNLCVEGVCTGVCEAVSGACAPSCAVDGDCLDGGVCIGGLCGAAMVADAGPVGGGSGGGSEPPGPTGCGCGETSGSTVLLALGALVSRRRRG